MTTSGQEKAPGWERPAEGDGGTETPANTGKMARTREERKGEGAPGCDR